MTRRPAPFDLLRLDGDVATARRALAAGEDPALFFAGPLRVTSQRSVLDALLADGAPLPLALAEHVAALLTLRLAEKTLAPLRAHLAAAREEVRLRGGVLTVSPEELLRELPARRLVDERAPLIDAAGRLGLAALGLLRAHRDLCAELAPRLPDVPPRERWVPVAPAVLFAESEPIFEGIRASGGSSYAAWLRFPLAEGAGSSLPLRLTPAAAAPWIPALAPAWVDPTGGGPEARALFARPFALRAPADLARLLGRFGRAFVLAAPRERAPYALARRPADRRAAILGAVAAALPGRVPFQRRAFGLPPPAARDEARRFLLAEIARLRVAAHRDALAAAPPLDGAAAEHLRHDVGALPRGAELLLFGPLRPSADAPRGEDAAILAHGLALEDRLTELFDDDWFRNPRAAAFLRAALDDPGAFVAEAPSAAPLLRRATELL